MKSYIEIQTVIDDLKSLASSIRYSDGDTDYYRLNDGNVKRQTLDRLDSLVRATAGRGITYKALIA
jgi:hypothetical protein